LDLETSQLRERDSVIQARKIKIGKGLITKKKMRCWGAGETLLQIAYGPRLGN